MVTKQPVFISEANVRSVLDSMVYSSQEPKETPLIHLLLVEDFISDPDFPATNLARRYALQEIILTTITGELKQHRTHYALVLEPQTAALNIAAKAIQLDAAQQNPELMSWSCLYYRYARVDLAISLNDYGDLLSVDVRTVRRYFSHAIRRLTEKLIELEANARQHHHRQHLLAMLPSATAPKLQGRAGQLNTLLGQAHLPQHFLITGPSGIGKTALIHAALHTKISRQEVDDLIWLDKPLSIQYIQHFLADHLQIDLFFLRKHTLDYKIHLIFDNADELLQGDFEGLVGLLADLSNATVYLTGRYGSLSPIPASLVHIPLQDLQRADAEHLIDHMLRTQSLVETLYPDEIWNRVGGNPLAIKLFVRNAAICGSFLVEHDPLRKIYDDVFAVLEVQVQHFWLLLAFFPNDLVTYPALEQLATAFNLPSSRLLLNRLAQHHVLAFSDPQMAYGLTHSAREYVHNLYRDGHRDVVEGINSLLDELAEFNDFLGLPVAFIEAVLTASWLNLPEDLYARWLGLFFPLVRQSGDYLSWLNAFEQYEKGYSTHIYHQFALGICLRNLGQWAEAEQAFSAVLQQSGEKGMFLLLAECLFELGVLMRVQGRYEVALSCYERSGNLAQHYQLDTLYQQILLEYAQIAFDQGAFAECLSLLNADALIDFSQNQQVRLLKSEALAANGNFREAHVLAEKAIAENAHNKQLLGRAYISLARVYEFHSLLSESFDTLSQAVILLEQANDQIGLARAKCNLAVIIAKTGLEELHQAQSLLLQAKTTQEQTGDRLALAITLQSLSAVEQQLLS